jgi:divalent metal cation (Fe/Co/Zn/Cd) transporter
VNLVAAILALVALTWAERPPDEEHEYGHEKAEYLSAGAEGALIVVAAVTAIYLVVQWSPDAIYEIDAILIGLIAGALLSLILFKLALGRFWPWG